MASLALTVILKNEMKNLKSFCEDVAGLFDNYHFTDTGSTDGSLEFLNSAECEKILGKSPILHQFEWINDFAKARNHALPHIKDDFWMWLDLDDRLHNREVFKKWKEFVMHLGDAWYAKYDYAFDKGVPVCSFVRERVLRTRLGLRFEDQVHEGVSLTRVPGQIATSWWVDHVRTDEELKGDKGRNLRILEEKKSELSVRLKFYHGKELYDADRIEEACDLLIEAVKHENLTTHDRVLGVQYLCWSLLKLNRTDEAIRYAMIGLNIAPTRAEFLCAIGDAYLFKSMATEAIPWFRAAVDCPNVSGSGFSSVFTSLQCYGEYPRIQLGKIFFFLADFERAKNYVDGIQHPEAAQVLLESSKALSACAQRYDQEEVSDIVITTPQHGAYLWDGELYRSKGMGGSETAAIEMAEWLRKKTGRKVIIFNPRETPLASNGILYQPMKSAFGYFQKYRPKLSIQWRHHVRLSDGPSVLWCHDLITPNAESLGYDKMLCLSNFHKNYVMGVQGIAEDKITLTRNGVDPKRFPRNLPEKRYGKVIWPNSPDRGLEHAIRVMDLVRARIPEATLDVFYGFENLEKFGMAEKAKSLLDMIKSRPWIKNHGNVDQKTLAEEFAESQVWLYTANFIETFCITAVEALLSKCWPVVRKVGALADTLGDANRQGMADLLDLDLDESTYSIWAQYVISAIQEDKWTQIQIEPSTHSWESVADEWIKEFDL